MRNSIREFVEVFARTLPIRSTIYEFGAWLPEGQEDLANLRNIFPGFEYVGCDMREGNGVDRVLNLHEIALDDGCVGTVICCDTMEHVEYPRQAVNEIYRILDSSGIALFTSVMDFPIHSFPHDYWRFTPEGFRSLLKPFDYCFIGEFGTNPLHPQTVVGVGFKGRKPNLDAFEIAYAQWKHRQETIMRKLSALPTVS